MTLLLLLLSVTTLTLEFDEIESAYDPDQYVVVAGGSFVIDTTIPSPFGGRSIVKRHFEDSFYTADSAKKFQWIGQTEIGNANRLSFLFVGDWDTTDVLYQFAADKDDFNFLSQWDTLIHFGITAETQWEKWLVVPDSLFAPHIKLKIVPHSDTLIVLKLRLCKDLR